jgi:exonuclease III
LIVRLFHTQLLPLDNKINNEASKLNDSIAQKNLTDTYRVFHPAAAQYTFFSAAQGTFSKIQQILGHKGSHSKQKN